MSTDAITVGAVDAGNTPAFGGTLQSESYSSSGLDTQLWFNFNGSTVANGPLDLSPVALSGVDDISTSVSGGLSDFFGTSAATPSVAAVVALMLQENPNLTFAQVEQILDQTATSFGNSEVAGAGLVNAAAAVAAAGAIGDDVVSWAAAVSGSFAIAANWTPETVPGSSNNVEIVSSGSYIVTSSASETVNSLIIALGATLMSPAALLRSQTAIKRPSFQGPYWPHPARRLCSKAPPVIRTRCRRSVVLSTLPARSAVPAR